jgi:hypothetical protein
MTFRTVPELVDAAAERFGNVPAIVATNHVESFVELRGVV